jgi:hypothetical protein
VIVLGLESLRVRVNSVHSLGNYGYAEVTTAIRAGIRLDARREQSPQEIVMITISPFERSTSDGSDKNDGAGE